MILGHRRSLSQSKVVSISNIRPPMQAALDPRRRRRDRRDPASLGMAESFGKGAATAGQVAQAVLNNGVRRLVDSAACDATATAKVDRHIKKGRRFPRRNWRQYMVIGLAMVVITCLIGLVEWYVVFDHQPEIRVPVKTFEQAR